MTNNNRQLLFNEIKERLNDQFKSVNSIDTKAGIILGFDGAILTALLNSDWFRSLPLYYLLPILLLVCLVTVYALIAFLARGYRKDPDPTKLIKNYQDKSETETLNQLIRNFESSFSKNIVTVKEKKKYLNISFKLLALTVIVISVVVLFSSIQSAGMNSYRVWKFYNQEVIKHDRFE